MTTPASQCMMYLLTVAAERIHLRDAPQRNPLLNVPVKAYCVNNSRLWHCEILMRCVQLKPAVRSLLPV
jgi:hypothetical protein